MNFIRLTFLFAVLFTRTLQAQTPISGVINTYEEVSQIDLTTNSVTLTSNTGFSSGDLVLLIQMQGATIDQSQNSDFGTITNLNNCGNYEVLNICKVQGTKIIFNHKILNNYTPSGKVQLIKIPEYQSAIITGGDLSCSAWNGTTGGVVILKAETLNLGTQNIDVTGTGFRGGTANISGAGCSFVGDFSYYTSITNSDANAPKGEGIANVIAGKECGRGPQANGGGGGNNHNGGGSGGANYGSGGAGGKRIKESTFTCGSENGINSKSLSSGYASNKIFMGGGGGAGHGNNGNSNGESGLNGGGIVIVISQTVIGNSQNIFANGQVSPIDANGDGAGGGGAGGTVLLETTSYSNLINIETIGSNGINTNNGGSNNCSGPGGGAGGGAILVSGNSFPSQINDNVSGGTSGIIATTSQSNCTVGSTNGGQDGANGSHLLNLLIPKGNDIFASKNLTEIACDTYTSPSGTYVWDSTGVYYDTLITNGCDSTFVINLTVNNVDTTVVINNFTLSSVVIGGTYQWINCENYTLIPGATNQSYTVTTNGSYALEVTKFGCTDTSECHNITKVGINEHNFGPELKVFPNPTSGKIQVALGSSYESISISVTSITGVSILEDEIFNTDQFTVTINEAAGVYFLHLKTSSGKLSVSKIIIE